MARAVLQIDVDTSGVRRAMGDLRGTARTAQAAMTAEARRAATQRDRIARDEIRHKQRLDIETIRSARDADRSRTQSAANASRERVALIGREGRAEAARIHASAAVFIAAERNKTRAIEREERARTRTAQAEERKRVADARAAASELSRTQRTRERAGRDIGYGLRRGLNVGGDAALNVGRVAYSQIRDARRTRAESENTLNGAFYQARLTGPEAAAARTRIEAELATGSLRGMSMEDVAGGLSQAQTQFNVLAGSNPAARTAALERQIQLLAFARNTYQAPGEVLRVAGMLERQGVTGADQMNTIRAMTGMAQAGSIELSTMTSSALGPLMQNIARSVTGAMSPAQRAQAIQSATRETMAVGEITAAGGLSPRLALNAMAALRSEVESPMMAGRLRQRLTNEGRGALAEQLTQQDASGRVTLRNRNALGFVSELMQGMGNDSNAVSNLLRSGGSRNAMVLGSPVRTLINALASQGTGGRSVAENVAAMQREGGTFGAADEARGRALRDSEQLTEINAQETKRLNALNDTSDAVVRFGRALDNFTAEHPVGSAAIQAGGGLVGGLLSGALLSRVGTALANTGVGRFVTGAAGRAPALVEGAATTAGAVARAAPRLAGRALLRAGGGLAAGLSAVGAFGGTDYEENQRRMAASAEWQRQSERLGAQATATGRPAPTAEEIGAAVAAALRANPPMATIDPHTANHAASQTAAQRAAVTR